MKKICKVILAAAAVVALAVPAMAADKLIVRNDGNTADVFKVDGTGMVTANVFTVDTVNKKVGSGLSAGHAAEASFHVVDLLGVAARGVIVAQHNDGGQAANVIFQKSRGNDILANRTMPIFKDFVGAFHGAGWDGAKWITSNTINFQVDGAPATDKVPMAMLFSTGENSNTVAGVITKVARMYIGSNGKVGVGGGFTPDTPPVLSGTGVLHVKGDIIRLEGTRTPAQASACNAGEIAWDASFMYVCTATNTWKRASLAAY